MSRLDNLCLAIMIRYSQRQHSLGVLLWEFVCRFPTRSARRRYQGQKGIGYCYINIFMHLSLAYGPVGVTQQQQLELQRPLICFFGGAGDGDDGFAKFEDGFNMGPVVPSSIPGPVRRFPSMPGST